MLKRVLALASVTFLLAGPAAARDVDIGVFAYRGDQEAVSDWSPFISYLNAALPEHRFRLNNYDAPGLRDAIAKEQVDLVITNPGYYVAMEAEFGISRIATLVSPDVRNATRALGSVIFARSDRTQVKTLADLEGRTLAAIAPEAFGGYLIGARELLANGVDPESDLKKTLFVGLPMSRVVEAVQRGEADAGIVRTCQLEQMAAQGLIRLADFQVLGKVADDGFPCARSTPLYPDWPIAVTRRTDLVLAKRVARALLDMPETEGMHWSVPADYQPVRDVFREMKAGPYTYLRDITPQAIAKRFWPWLLGIAAVLAGWLVHTVRVEYQVLRRTAQLRESLEARKAAETRMRDNQEQMDHLSRLSVLGELSGGLAHEINQPLTTISTYARSMLRRQANGALTPEAVTEACTEIANEAERAAGIVQRIRNFVKKRDAMRSEIDLVAVADDAKRLVTGILAHPPSISIEDRTKGTCSVLADAPQIQQVLLNLIKNAVDAARDLPAERQGIELLIEQEDKRVVVHVTDRGAGLDPQQQARLFEPFFTTKPDGLGLGLSICKTIIEAHGGRLWAEPNPAGTGMRFSFSLPCHEHHT